MAECGVCGKRRRAALTLILRSAKRVSKDEARASLLSGLMVRDGAVRLLTMRVE
jgi:chemotaxis response regulator CheB